MFWLLFAWLTAFFESLTDVASKKGLQLEDVDEYIVSFSIRFFAFLFLIPVLILMILFIITYGNGELPTIGSQFWTALLIGGSLNVVTTVLYMKALKYSDLSISVPMLTFTPLFLLVTSPLILGEFPSSLGLVGIFLIVSGSYLLNIKEYKEGYLAPFKALLRERGPKLMLLVAFIWSITSNYDKIGALNSSPLIWILAINLFIAICMIPIMARYSQTSSLKNKTQERSFMKDQCHSNYSKDFSRDFSKDFYNYNDLSKEFSRKSSMDPSSEKQPSREESFPEGRSPWEESPPEIRSSQDKMKNNLVLIQQNWKNMIIMGFLSALTSIFQIYAITLTLVAYVIAIKRTSVVFSVLWGHYLFHEKGVKERLLGASIMVIGVVFIVLS